MIHAIPSLELSAFSSLKCPITGHKKSYTHICSKPKCNKPRLYCSKCILLPNYECNGNIVLIEDLILQNFSSLEGWIPDQCIRDLLNRDENDESLKIPSDKDIKDYVNKKLEPTINSFLEEIVRAVETVKKDLAELLIKEFELRQECFQKLKKYYDCNDIMEILKVSNISGANHMNKIQMALNYYFNSKDINCIRPIVEATKVINLHPLKNDHLKSVTKNFNELKTMIGRLIKIEPKKFEENTMKLKAAMITVNNSLKQYKSSQNNLDIQEKEDIDLFPSYDKPFNLENFLKKTHSQANLLPSFRSITPKVTRPDVKPLNLDFSNTQNFMTINKLDQSNLPSSVRHHQRNESAITGFNNYNINYFTSLTPRDLPRKVLNLGERCLTPTLADQEMISQLDPLLRRHGNSNININNNSTNNTTMVESLFVEISPGGTKTPKTMSDKPYTPSTIKTKPQKLLSLYQDLKKKVPTTSYIGTGKKI